MYSYAKNWEFAGMLQVYWNVESNKVYQSTSVIPFTT